MIYDYKILEAYSKEELEKQVIEYINNDWQPDCFHVVQIEEFEKNSLSHYGSIRLKFFQTMIRKSP